MYHKDETFSKEDLVYLLVPNASPIQTATTKFCPYYVGSLVTDTVLGPVH